jgi:hypothetical protein
MENFIIAILFSIGAFLFLNRRRASWYKRFLRGPTKDMSKSKIILGCIISVIILLVALIGNIGVLLRIAGFIEPSPPSTTECLVGKDWCHPDCSNAIEHWKFQLDSTFIYGGNGGTYAWGTWKDIGSNQIEIIYTQAPTEDELSKEILSMPDCSSLKVGDNVFSSY